MPAKPATCTEEGYEAYYVCTRCQELFADENATMPLLKPNIIPAVGRIDLPQTGDSSHLLGWLAMLGACCAGLWCVSRRRG